MIRLCLFDLDQTLVDTDDLKELREAGKHRDDAGYADEVRAAFRTRDRVLISGLALDLAKLNNMDLRFGVFTRSPRRYVDVVLAEAYENRRWDVVIAYEDVQRYKPSGQGIIRAMKAVGMQTVAASRSADDDRWWRDLRRFRCGLYMLGQVWKWHFPYAIAFLRTGKLAVAHPLAHRVRVLHEDFGRLFG